MATRKPIIYINGYPSELDIASDRLNTPWIYRSGSAPSAQTADMWYDTTNSLLKMWNGSAWESVGGSKVYIQTSAPSSGMNEGDWWHNTTDSSTKIYLAGSINAWTACCENPSPSGRTTRHCRPSAAEAPPEAGHRTLRFPACSNRRRK